MRIILVSIFLLQSCATYLETQCKNFDWEAEGTRQANLGKTVDEGLAHFNQTCGEDWHIKPDEKTFVLGHESGLKSFCSKENAYQFGKSGGDYKGTCKEMNEVFLNSYHGGLVEYLKAEITRLKGESSDAAAMNLLLQNENHLLEMQNQSMQTQQDVLLLFQ